MNQSFINVYVIKKNRFNVSNDYWRYFVTQKCNYCLINTPITIWANQKREKNTQPAPRVGNHEWLSFYLPLAEKIQHVCSSWLELVSCSTSLHPILCREFSLSCKNRSKTTLNDILVLISSRHIASCSLHNNNCAKVIVDIWVIMSTVFKWWTIVGCYMWSMTTPCQWLCF